MPAPAPASKGKTRLGILCGGPSAEHRISLLSSRNILAGAAPERYEPVLLGVDTAGRWWHYETPGHLVRADDADRVALAPGGRPVAPVLTEAGGRLLRLDGAGEAIAVDVIFPVMHGPYGEDGTVQALLEAVQIPYVGSGVAASALCMDKDHAKTVLRAAGLPVVDWLTIERGRLDRPGFDALGDRLGDLPWFVKPARLGSSVGISRVEKPGELEAALVAAFEFDEKVLVEKGIDGRELECAVLGNRTPEASGVGEIVVKDGFYSYEAKYLDASAAELHLAAELDGEVRERIRTLAVEAFRTLGCRGLARVDFFLGRDGRLYVNELNTMPGFTRISMYPKLWEREGLSNEQLVDRLVALALER